MKKKIVVLLMASTLALSACGTKSAETAQTTAATEAVTETETSVEETTIDASTDAESVDANQIDAGMEALSAIGEIKVDKSGDTVKMTYPEILFQGLTEEEIKESIEADGVKTEGVTLNEDGSVVVELNKEDYQVMLDEAKAGIEESLNQMTAAFPSVKEVTVNDDCTEFTVLCDGALYTEADSAMALSFSMIASTYQILDGVEADDIHVVVDMVDAENDDVLYHFDSRE